MQQISKKVILVGNFGVGKTSLVRRFVYQKFSDEYLTTLGVRIDKKVITFPSLTVNMILWDIAGEVSQTKVPISYYLGAHGVIYVFDLQRPSSYERIQEDIQYIQTKLPDAPICIIGNKKDLLSDDELKSVQQKLSVDITFFTSAKTGENVENMFQLIAQQMTE